MQKAALVLRSPTRLSALKKVPEGGEPHDLNAMSVVLSAKHNHMVPGCSCEHAVKHINQVVLNTVKHGVCRHRQPRWLLKNTHIKMFTLKIRFFFRGEGVQDLA